MGEKQWVRDLLRQDLVTFRELKYTIEWHENTGLAFTHILENLIRKKQTVVDNALPKHSRRRFKRDTFIEIVEIESTTGTHLVRMNSISRGGASILFDHDLPMESEITLRHANLNVLARVINKTKTEKGWLLGLEFSPTCLEDVLEQEEFLAHYKRSTQIPN